MCVLYVIAFYFRFCFLLVCFSPVFNHARCVPLVDSVREARRTTPHRTCSFCSHAVHTRTHTHVYNVVGGHLFFRVCGLLLLRVTCQTLLSLAPKISITFFNSAECMCCSWPATKTRHRDRRTPTPRCQVQALGWAREPAPAPQQRLSWLTPPRLCGLCPVAAAALQCAQLDG